MNNQSIKAILFDFGGTLDNDGSDWMVRYHKLISDITGNIAWEQFTQFTRKAADAMCEHTDIATLSMEDTARRLCSGIHQVMSNEATICTPKWNVDILSDEFIKSSHKYLQRNYKVLSQLKERYALGCISNNWGNVSGWCKQFGYDEFFDIMIDSALVDSVKPEGKIFKVALNELGLAANECAYVGDNFTCDVYGSYNAGLRPVWITSCKTVADASAGCFHNPVPIETLQKINHIKIKSLTELNNIVTANE